MSRSVVVYHYPCFDGVFAAFSHWLFLGRWAVHPVTYLPLKVTLSEVEIQSTLHRFRAQDTVYFLDMIGPVGMIDQVCDMVDSVTLLDHHLTAKEYLETMHKRNNALPKNLETVIDMNRSGAGISWDYFSAKTKNPLDVDTHKRLHDMILYVQDIDIWQHKVPGSKEFNAGFGGRNLEMSHELNAKIFDELFSLDSADLVDSGKEILVEQARIVDAAVATAVPMTVSYTQDGVEKEVKCLGVTVDDKVANYRSDIGNQLAVRSAKAGRSPCAVVCTEYEDNSSGQAIKRMKISFRSFGDFNTAAISQCFGGGGHKNASSFTTTPEVYQKMFEEQRQQ